MTFAFDWNESADQPHNVAPRRERMGHHLRRADGYLTLFAWNLWKIGPIWLGYRRLRRSMFGAPTQLQNAFGCAVSPVEGREERVAALLSESGARQTLVRVPSWERKRLDRLEAFVRLLRSRNFEVTAALLQNRDDVRDPARWRAFLAEVFSRLGPLCSGFEVGHAWNRTKWGVWDYREYLDLAAPAFGLASSRGLRLIGPAVIDFEFHLYPPTLSVLPFDAVSSLLYVDRVGAPENAQAGWTTAGKVALLKSVVDRSARAWSPLWITEVNWPLEGTGPYAPAAGRPCVSEEEQASYLVRYHVLCLASGYVERVYWWQLAAPGYGLVDSRAEQWRPRPGFFAYQTMTRYLEGSLFVEKEPSPWAEVYHFRKAGDPFAVCWTAGPPREYRFRRPVARVLNRDGREAGPASSHLLIEGSPRYVFFRE
jgi:hypothetical protein